VSRLHPSVGALVFDALLLIFVATIVGTATGLAYGARLVPLLIGVPTLALLVVQLAIDLRRRRRPVSRDDRREAIGGALSGALHAARVATTAPADETPDELRRQVVLALWALALVALGALTSLTIALPPMLAVIFRAAGTRWPLNLVLTVALSAGFFCVFDVLLEVRF
jgi:hypothetical protein